MNELIVRPTMDLVSPKAAGSGAADFSFAQKAAIILSILDPADAAELLRGFDQSSLLKFAKVISAQKAVPTAVLLDVVNEFLAELGEDTSVKGGAGQVRALLGQFLDEADVDRILADVEGSVKRSVWERLGTAPAAKIASYLQLQHPQAVSVALSKMRPNTAASVLELLDRDFAKEAVLRLSRIPTLDEKKMKKIESVIERDFLSAITRQAGSVNPAELIGDLMNNISSAARDEFLQKLDEVDAKLAQEVTRVMFTFADIVDRLEPRDVAMVIKETEDEDLMIAFKYAMDTDNPSLEFMLSNLSKRLTERIREDLDAMDGVKEKEGEAAQMKITSMIQKKAKMGEIKLIEKDDE